MVEPPNPFTDVKLTAVFSGAGRTYNVPVVCTSLTAPGADDVGPMYSVYFSPPDLGTWTWFIQVDGGTSPYFSADQHTDFSTVRSFLCIPSSNRGPWRAGPAPYEEAIVEPLGDGTTSFVWPASVNYFTLANPGWLSFPPIPYPLGGTQSGSMSMVTDALDWATENGFNRVRTSLTYIQNPNPMPEGNFMPPVYPPKVPRHTVFLANDPLARRQEAQDVDFDRFDLAVWDNLDAIIALAASRNLQVCVTLTTNASSLDYEQSYLATYPTDSSYPIVPPSSALRNISSPTNTSRFQKRDDLFYWYVAGRLCSYSNVQYCIFHEYNVDCNVLPGTNANATACYPNEWLTYFASKFASVEPYLTNDPKSKITTLLPRRGSLYSLHSHDQNDMENPQNTRPSSLGDNMSPFCTDGPPYNPEIWRSAIGLQRGGELGLTSILGLSIPTPHLMVLPGAPSPIAHRTLLGNNRLPVFIEEDWVVNAWFADLNHNPNPSATWNNQANPYCRKIGFGPFDALGNFTMSGTNPYSLPGLVSNQDGLHRYWRANTWMTGIIAKAYPTFTSNRYIPLHHTHLESSAKDPVKYARRFTEEFEWWKFNFQEGLVSQNPSPLPRLGAFTATSGPPVPYSGPQIEVMSIGAISDHGGAATQYVCFCPGRTNDAATALIPNLSVDLAALGPNVTVPYFFMNPDNGLCSHTLSITTLAAPDPITGWRVTFPLPPSSVVSLQAGSDIAAQYQPVGKHGEYVLFINAVVPQYWRSLL